MHMCSFYNIIVNLSVFGSAKPTVTTYPLPILHLHDCSLFFKHYKYYTFLNIKQYKDREGSMIPTTTEMTAVTTGISYTIPTTTEMRAHKDRDGLPDSHND